MTDDINSSSGPFDWRVMVHALDRTGPPMLALAFVRWLRRTHPGDDVELVAFRGGEMVSEFSEVTAVRCCSMITNRGTTRRPLRTGWPHFESERPAWRRSTPTCWCRWRHAKACR